MWKAYFVTVGWLLGIIIMSVVYFVGYHQGWIAAHLAH